MFGTRWLTNSRGPNHADSETLTNFVDASSGCVHAITHRDAYEGILDIGAPGSGKTSGFGRHMACSFLQNRYGGLVCTAKEDELATWANFDSHQGPLGYAALSGLRPQDVIVIGPRLDVYRSMGLYVPANGHAVNVLGAEYAFHASRSPMASTQNVAYLCTNATQGADESRSRAEPFWGDAERQLCTNAVDLSICATGGVSLGTITSIIRAAPRSRAEAWSRTWRSQSEFWSAFAVPAIRRTPCDHPRHVDLAQTLSYWLYEFPELAERTRSVIVTGFMAKLTPLLRGALRTIFSGDQADTFDPSLSHDGKLIILDLPLKLFGEPGRTGQLLLKLYWQRCMERRNANATEARPVFLWVDEAQLLVTPHDALFAQTARSQRVAVVLLTQNISNFYAALGGPDPRAAADSLLGNLQTKVFHANGDAVTNEWAERHFAKEYRVMYSRGLSPDGDLNHSQQQSLQPVILAREFTTLAKGGPENKGLVEAIVFQTGRRWDKSGRNFARVRFQQAAAAR